MLQDKRSLDDKRCIARQKRNVCRFNSSFNNFILFHLKLDIFYCTGVKN